MVPAELTREDIVNAIGALGVIAVPTMTAVAKHVTGSGKVWVALFKEKERASWSRLFDKEIVIRKAKQ